jgi:DNA-binding NarL/FixJ family response regulator
MVGGPRPIQILLVEPEPLFQLGFGLVLAEHPEFELAAVVSDGPSALACSEERDIDLFVVARRLPSLDGLEIARRLRERQPRARLLFLDREPPARPDLVTARSVGAAGIVARTHPPGALMESLRFAAAGVCLVAPEDQAPDPTMEPEELPASLRKLTRRQRQIFSRVVAGMTTEEIARELGLSTRTVGVHRTHITRRLGCRTAAAWVRFAVSQGLRDAGLRRALPGADSARRSIRHDLPEGLDVDRLDDVMVEPGDLGATAAGVLPASGEGD